MLKGKISVSSFGRQVANCTKDNLPTAAKGTKYQPQNAVRELSAEKFL